MLHRTLATPVTQGRDHALTANLFQYPWNGVRITRAAWKITASTSRDSSPEPGLE